MAKYPADCPVFESRGCHFEARPNIYHDGWIMMIFDDSDMPYNLPDNARPLTRAARELIAWSRQ